MCVGCAVAILVLGVLAGVSAQVTIGRPCPVVKTVPNFNAALYAGRWFEQEKFPTSFEVNQTCIAAVYQPGGPDGHIRVINRGYNYYQGRYVTVTGDAVSNPAAPGQLGVRFFPGQPRSSYNVLATDYRNFSLIFSCSDVQPEGGGAPTSSRQILWILARTRLGIPPVVRARLLVLARQYGIDPRYLVRTQQRACP